MRDVIDDKGKVLARHITREELRENTLGFFSDDEEQIQLGSWNYDRGKTLQRHFHNKLPRTFSITGETLIVMSGSLLAHIYDEEQQLLKSLSVLEGDALVLVAGGHGYEILEDNTHVIEVKNGPYLGADLDRTRF